MSLWTGCHSVKPQFIERPSQKGIRLEQCSIATALPLSILNLCKRVSTTNAPITHESLNTFASLAVWPCKCSIATYSNIVRICRVIVRSSFCNITTLLLTISSNIKVSFVMQHQLQVSYKKKYSSLSICGMIADRAWNRSRVFKRVGVETMSQFFIVRQ